MEEHDNKWRSVTGSAIASHETDTFEENKMYKLEQQIAETRNKLVELEKELKDSKAWPQDGDIYYMWSHDAAYSSRWEEFSWEFDMLRRGEVFKAKEECELDNEKRLILQRIKVLEKGFVPNFNDKNEDFYKIYYDKDSGYFFANCESTRYSGSIFGSYRTKDDAEDALDALGSANLKILAGIK